MTLMNPLPPLGEEPFDDEALDDWYRLDEDPTSRHLWSAAQLVATARVDEWRVENDDQAEWAARKLAAAGLLIREKEALRNWWVSQIEEWFVSETRQAQRTYAFFEGRLQDYALRERVEHGRATIKLPTAEFGTTARSPKVDVADDDALALWIDRHAGPWAEALGENGIDPLDLYRRSAKVYVGPLRKLVRVEERENGYEVHVVPACDHEQTWFAETLDAEVPSVGEIIRCDACDENVAVREVEFLPIVEPVVLGPDGEPLPGVVVDPGGISPKAVVPRG